MDDTNKKTFRFLSDEEFFRLSPKEKAMYLSMASQELESRQRKIRQLMVELVRENQQRRTDGSNQDPLD